MLLVANGHLIVWAFFCGCVDATKQRAERVVHRPASHAYRRRAVLNALAKACPSRPTSQPHSASYRSFAIPTVFSRTACSGRKKTTRDHHRPRAVTPPSRAPVSPARRANGAGIASNRDNTDFMAPPKARVNSDSYAAGKPWRVATSVAKHSAPMRSRHPAPQWSKRKSIPTCMRRYWPTTQS